MRPTSLPGIERIEVMRPDCHRGIFQDLDWVPANHLQAEDRAYRLGQRERVTVGYMLADGTLDVYIADLLETKLRLISAVETEVPPDGSMLEDLYNRLRALGPAPLQENRIASGSAAVLERLTLASTRAWAVRR
jgi:hypothetical protein